MTKFLDGPAGGVMLMLRRAPLFLRVTCRPFTLEERKPGRFDPTRRWDACDQFTDTPETSEDVYVYRLVAGPWSTHIRARHGSGFYQGGEYRFIDEPFSAEVLRDNERWRVWCEQNSIRFFTTPGAEAQL